MVISQSYALTLALILGLEYWLKEWWEPINGKFAKPLRSYVCYRLVHFVLLLILGFFLYSELILVNWLVCSLAFVLLGSLEIPLTAVCFRMGESWKGLCLLILPLLAFCARYVHYMPAFNLDHKVLLLFVFLAHPSNYIIRWAFNKHEFSLVKTLALSILQRTPDSRIGVSVEVAATSSKGSEQNLNVGRRIGTLERWLILLLVLSDNVNSLGLVITAKSIVRYPRLSDPEFAEYYLLGTLLSVILALASAFLFLGGM